MKFSVSFIGLLALAGVSSIFAQNTPPMNPLSVSASDVRIEAFDDGYHLIVRQKPGLGSVMLTEAFEPNGHKLATYSYRGLEPNKINGDEKRVLNGSFLKAPHTDLICSTPTQDSQFGKAFVILIPPTVEYGYKDTPGARYGRIDVHKTLLDPDGNLWFSVRAFSKPYGDYTGTYADNAFEMKKLVAQTVVPQTSQETDKDVALLERLAPVYKAQGADDGVKKIQDTVQDDLDLVICIDTTKSMGDYLKIMRTDLLGSIRQEASQFHNFRVGLVFYRDYMEEYLTKVVTFQTDMDVLQRELDAATASGGGDVPEAVVEAMWSALNAFDWKAGHRLVIVIGDAPQHDIPRGKITEAMVHEMAREKHVEFQIVKLPPGDS